MKHKTYTGVVRRPGAAHRPPRLLWWLGCGASTALALSACRLDSPGAGSSKTARVGTPALEYLCRVFPLDREALRQRCPKSAGSLESLITSPFGERRGSTSHNGIDLACPADDRRQDGHQATLGIPVVAMQAGRITHINNPRCGHGAIVKNHNGEQQGYCHLLDPRECRSLSRPEETFDPSTLSDGTWIQAGEQLGCIGNTGTSTGPHLHFVTSFFPKGRSDAVRAVDPKPTLHRLYRDQPEQEPDNALCQGGALSPLEVNWDDRSGSYALSARSWAHYADYAAGLGFADNARSVDRMMVAVNGRRVLYEGKRVELLPVDGEGSEDAWASPEGQVLPSDCLWRGINDPDGWQCAKPEAHDDQARTARIDLLGFNAEGRLVATGIARLQRLPTRCPWGTWRCEPSRLFARQVVPTLSRDEAERAGEDFSPLLLRMEIGLELRGPVHGAGRVFNDLLDPLLNSLDEVADTMRVEVDDFVLTHPDEAALAGVPKALHGQLGDAEVYSAIAAPEQQRAAIRYTFTTRKGTAARQSAAGGPEKEGMRSFRVEVANPPWVPDWHLTAALQAEARFDLSHPLAIADELTRDLDPGGDGS